ncbi:MAG: hypothetical protein LBG27_11960 [Spirochaetaceae bacterium]|jgi:hypothetical protein|nr:hypothetical protein [Spirochaetaceae bacterium]
MCKEGQYGNAAVEAVRLYTSGEMKCLPKAWYGVITQFTDSPSSQEKPCPIETFLGLCEAGLVKGVRKGTIRFTKNKDYGIRGVEALKKDSSLAKSSAAKLWGSIDNNGETHNGQMDVVRALWRAGLIEKGED